MFNKIPRMTFRDRMRLLTVPMEYVFDEEKGSGVVMKFKKHKGVMYVYGFTTIGSMRMFD